MKAIHLTTEYLTNPVGVDFTRPHLSWTCEGGVKQTAYRVMAYKFRAEENNENEVIWDSGKVTSSKMHLIAWGGSDLKSRDRVIWKVTLWDENDEEGPVSDPATIGIGLLSEADWTAQWITGDYKVDPKKRYPVDIFRKKFTLPDTDRKIVAATAYMTACGLYEGTLNGQKIGDFCLAPGITDYRKRVQYQTADITELLQSGENTLEFMLADGWYRGSVGAWGMKNYYGTETKLLVQIEMDYADGSRQTVATDGTWEWTNRGPIRFADNKDGEKYDARKEAFAADPTVVWKPAKVTVHNVAPQASDNFALTEHDHLTAPETIITPSGKKVFDFRQNIAGYAELTFNAKEGEKLWLRFGEKLDPEGEFTQKNIQCVNKKITTPLQQVLYICKEGENHYKTRFAIFGFQYVEVTGSGAKRINAENIEAVPVYSDCERTFTFESSNVLLNQFVENTCWSFRNNSADLLTDCPTRERHGWSGDAQIFTRTASYMVNFAPFALKYENDLCDWQTKDGKFPQIAPEGGTDAYMRSMNGSVGWADAGVMIPYRLWKQYDDFGIIEKYYEPMCRYAHFVIGRLNKWQPMISEKTGLSREDKKYLYNYGQHYGEWAEPADVHKMEWKDFASAQPEVATAYAAYVMRLMTEIAEKMGRSEDAALFKEYAEGCKHTYQELRRNPRYTLDTDRQASLVRPLYFDLLDEEQKAYAQERLLQAMENYGWRIGTGFLSTPLILYVLQEIDPEYAYRLLENEEKPGWLFMPKTGATTIWEDWEGPTSDNGKGGGIASLDHYSKGAVCEWVFEEMCGIHVDGGNHFTIAPVPGGHFTHAGMTYDSVFGSVGCCWEKVTGEEDAEAVKYRVRVKIPANTTATVILPGKEAGEYGPGEYTISI